MIIGKVVGSLFSTRKSEKLVGNKFMIVEPVETMKAAGERVVAIDIIGAGIGEYVLVGAFPDKFFSNTFLFPSLEIVLVLLDTLTFY